MALSEVWAKGGAGGEALAREVVRLCEEPNRFCQSYPLELSIEEKLDAICRKVYRADGVQLTAAARKQMKQLTDLGFGGLPAAFLLRRQILRRFPAVKIGAGRANEDNGASVPFHDENPVVLCQPM